MSSEKEENSSHSGLGCTTPLGVLILGLGLSLFGSAVGGGLSVRIPLTDKNISIAGSVGRKDVTRQALPNYIENKVATSENFFNTSHTLTIWVAEGTGLFVIGSQPGAPLIDINLGLVTQNGKIGTESPRFLSYQPREVKNK